MRSPKYLCEANIISHFPLHSLITSKQKYFILLETNTRLSCKKVLLLKKSPNNYFGPTKSETIFYLSFQAKPWRLSYQTQSK